MKKRIALLLTAFILSVSISFANGNNPVPAEISHSFSHHFATAKNVNWEKISNVYKASFELDGNYLFVFYSEDAHFIGIAHNILSDKLPMMLQAQLKMDYSNYWITELIEYSVDHNPGYKITLENADQKVILKSDNLSDWAISSKTAKAE
jgi:hypothetical protein